MVRRMIALGLLALGFTLGARADDARDLFARYKQASGGERWDAVQALRSEGTLKAGGLEGAFGSVVGMRGLYHLASPRRRARALDGGARTGRCCRRGGARPMSDGTRAVRRARVGLAAGVQFRELLRPRRLGVGDSHEASTA